MEEQQRRAERSLTVALRPPEKLPARAVWAAILSTSVGMAVANLGTVFAMEFLVDLKFDSLQAAVDYGGVLLGTVVLMGIAVGFAAIAAGLIHGFAPDAGGSGSPENKGWLNGCNMHRFFTKRNLVIRALATILANATGYPVGREGPSVTMGSNMAFLICKAIAMPHAKEWADLQGPSPGAMADESFFARAARVASAVGGACGIAMIFNAPLGGILYMFEDISPTAWPVELTFQAFVGCIVCTTVSYCLLSLCGTSIHSFVIFELWSGTETKDYTVNDIPGFIVTSVILGLFAPLHTRLCLKVLDWRKKLHATPTLQKRQPWPKIADALLYAALCALVAAIVSLLGNCLESSVVHEDDTLDFFRYNCPPGRHNPVASLLLTTAEAAVKRLFSRSDVYAFELSSLVWAFIGYSSLNIGLTGVPVPAGNFTGTMMIGGLMGRIVGDISTRLMPNINFAVPGIYSMVGAAAMLCSFKQMSVAVVLFIVTCSNNVELVVPLMFAVSISLMISKCLRAPAFDEEQVRRKKILVLEPEPIKPLKRCLAKDLTDNIPPEAILLPQMAAADVRQALALCEAPFLPVLADGRCLGLVTRTRLEAALQVGPSIVKTARLADPPFILILDDTPASKFYALFAKAQTRAACVVSSAGNFCGVVSRNGLATAALRLEEEEHRKVETQSEDDDEDGDDSGADDEDESS